MQVPIMAGTKALGGFSASYPINLEPRAIASGISQGQLVSTRGAVVLATGPGIDRGGIEWNGTLYRVMGSKLVSVTEGGAITELGEVGNDNGTCGFDYSFDRLAIRSAGKLFYWTGAVLTEVTDADLGDVFDMLWMDGYFVTTDGSYIVATDLLDPTSINPLKYGSAEEDPDMVVGLLKYREELYAVGRYTIQVFSNVGGLNFPFTVQNGAMIPYGAVGPRAKTLVGGTFAFVGGGRGDPLGVYVYSGGTAERISSREIDDLLAAHSTPGQIEMEARNFAGESHLLIHLEKLTIGIALNASGEAQQGAWYVCQSGRFGPYRLRNAVYCYGKHIVGDTQTAQLGVLSAEVETHFGEAPDWQFDTAAMFNDGKGFVVQEIELFGQFPTTENAVFLSMSRDGVEWSNEVARVLTGRRDERVVWRPNVRVPSFGVFRWRGSGRVALARAEVGGEALAA